MCFCHLVTYDTIRTIVSYLTPLKGSLIFFKFLDRLHTIGIQNLKSEFTLTIVLTVNFFQISRTVLPFTSNAQCKKSMRNYQDKFRILSRVSELEKHNYSRVRLLAIVLLARFAYQQVFSVHSAKVRFMQQVRLLARFAYQQVF